MTKINKILSNNTTSKKNFFDKEKARARRKAIGYNHARKLLHANPDSKVKKMYLQAMYCMHNRVVDENGKIITHYCKTRLCPECSAIMTARLINGYKPQLDQYTDLYFVTLTLPNVKGEELADTLDYINKVWRRIKDNAKKQEKNLNGIRKIEITTNAQRKDFHPHLHLLIDGKDKAIFTAQQWVKILQKDGIKAENYCQNIRKCTGDYIEIFKYVTKPVTKEKDEELNLWQLKAENLIFEVIKGRRIIQPFGNLHFVNEEFTDEELNAQEETTTATPNTTYIYVPSAYDWICTSTGEALTGYTPTKADLKLIGTPPPDEEKTPHEIKISA